MNEEQRNKLDELISDVEDTARELVARFEWGSGGVMSAQRDLDEAKEALKQWVEEMLK